jgi:membrane protein implicated in regulation of membrane protease activity
MHGSWCAGATTPTGSSGLFGDGIDPAGNDRPVHFLIRPGTWAPSPSVWRWLVRHADEFVAGTRQRAGGKCGRTATLPAGTTRTTMEHREVAVDDWVIWLIFAVVLGVAELFTLTAALGVLGAAALVTTLFAAFLPLPFQLLAFTIAATAGVVLIRPIALRHMRQPQLERFGVDALVGKPAYVLEEVTGFTGRVRIGGEEWTARAYDETLVIAKGTVVDVMEIKGSTALVYPRE